MGPPVEERDNRTHAIQGTRGEHIFSQIHIPRDGLSQPHSSPNTSPLINPDSEHTMFVDDTEVQMDDIFEVSPAKPQGSVDDSPDYVQPWLEILQRVEKRWTHEKSCNPVECAEALAQCSTHRSETRTSEFIREMLFHILEFFVNCQYPPHQKDQESLRQIFTHACFFIVWGLKGEQTALLSSLRLLCDDKLALFRTVGRELLLQNIRLVSKEVKDIVFGMSFHELCFSRLFLMKDAEAIFKCCTPGSWLLIEPGLETANSFFEDWGSKIAEHIRELTVDTVVPALTDSRNKQINADGLERLCRQCDRCSCEKRAEIHDALRHLAVACTHSQKIMIRRAGLEIFTVLAKLIPDKAGEWIMEGGERSVLADLTGERAHEILVDLLRAFMYSRDRIREGPVEAEFLDCVMSTCLGKNQHPTKDVRDAFRSALAKLVLSLTEFEKKVNPAIIAHQINVNCYLLKRVLKELNDGTEGSAQLTLSLLKEWDYDPVSICNPSPKNLVGRHTNEHSVLADLTIHLLWAAFTSPCLADHFDELVHSMAICLQNGPSVGRPGVKKTMAKDVDLLVQLCRDALGEPEVAEHTRTVACKVLLQLLFFHLRSDNVQSAAKWNHPGHENPKHLDWAKEGKVPMLALRRADWIGIIQSRYRIIDLVVEECCLLEEQAIAARKVDSEDHQNFRWLRLELLRFLHVEAEERTLSVSYEILERLWRQLPAEICCKWLRVLADSGEALTEEVTELAFKRLVCGVDLPRLGKHGFNCFEALFGEINSRPTLEHRKGRMMISGRQVVHKGIKVSGQNLVRRRVSWFCCTQLRRNVGTITHYDDSPQRQEYPFDFENDDLFDGKKKSNRLVPLDRLFDCHIVEDSQSPEDIKAFEIDRITVHSDMTFGCNLIGMDELWRVVLEALDDGVAARARDMLLSLSRKLPVRFMDDFLDAVFDEIKTLDGEDVLQSPMVVEGHDSPMQIESEEIAMQVERTAVSDQSDDLRISRALALLQTFLDAHILACQAPDIMPHSCCLRGVDLQITIIQRNKLRHKNAVENVSKGTEGLISRENVELNLHSKITLRELQDLAALQFRSKPGEKVQLSHSNGGQLLTGKGKTLEELGIVDKAVLHLDIIDEAVGDAQNASTILRLMARDVDIDLIRKRFNILLTRLEQEEKRCGRSTLQQQIWNVLASLPTAPFLLDQLSQSFGCFDDWSSWFGPNVGVWRSIYQLQIIDSIILPRGEFGEQDECWRNNFIFNGGLDHLCRILLAFCSKQRCWSQPNRLSWQLGVPTILRLLKFLLHGAFKALRVSREKGGSRRQSPSEGMDSCAQSPVVLGKEGSPGLETDPVSPRLRCFFSEEAARRILQADISGVLEHLIEEAIMVGTYFAGGLSASRSALLESMVLLNMIIRRLGSLSPEQRRKVFESLFLPKVPDGIGGCEALIRILLMRCPDAEIRQSTMNFLLHAVMVGAIADAALPVAPLEMAKMTAELVGKSLTRAIMSNKDDHERQPIVGSHFFDWASRVVNLRISGNYFLQPDETKYLLTLGLNLLTRGSTVASDSSVDVPISALPSGATAAGCLRLVLHLMDRLHSSIWSPICRQLSPHLLLFDSYLMHADPQGEPLLGWPDDPKNADARRAGWEALLQLCRCCDDDSACLSGDLLISNVVDRILQFTKRLPQPMRKTEEGVEELFSFSPEHNGLRHCRALVGLKNRRNTCYINSMLQQLFFTPQFCRWISCRRPVASQSDPARADSAIEEDTMKSQSTPPAGQGERQLSEALQRLLAALSYSEMRYYDPSEFIRACKAVQRCPPLLDAAHTQDDTMTFLEGMLETLSSVHGPPPADMFKVVEKERRRVHGTEEPRPIKGNEREYLMLEIEEGIGTLKKALDKHFSQELMSGDNQIWNEETGRKETVWKTPFLEAASLPRVLVVQLKRFKHAIMWDGRFETQKLNTRVEFPTLLDLSEYIGRQYSPYEAEPAAPGSRVYALQGVVVHSGQTIHSGHYYSFILDDAAGAWYRLDDDTVTEVGTELLQEECFGGTVESKDQYGDIKREDRWRSAYVLFYRLCDAPPLSPPSSPSPSPLPSPLPLSEHTTAAHSFPAAAAAESAAADDAAARPGCAAAGGSVAARAARLGFRCPGRLRREVEEASRAAALHLLAFDDGFVDFVRDLAGHIASKAPLAPAVVGRVHAAAPGGQVAAVAAARPQGETPAARGAAAGGQDAALSDTSDVDMDTAAAEQQQAHRAATVAAAAGGGGPGRLPAWLVGSMAQAVSQAFIKIVSRRDYPAAARRWAEAAAGLLEMSLEGSISLLGEACAPQPPSVSSAVASASAAELPVSAAEETPPAAATLLDRLVLQHPAAEVRGAFGLLLVRAACTAAAAAAAAEGWVGGSGGGVGTEPEAARARLLEAVLDMFPTAVVAWIAANSPPREEPGQIDGYLGLAVELVRQGCVRGDERRRLVSAWLDQLRRGGTERPVLTKRLIQWLAALGESPAAAELLREHVGEWAWAVEWLHRAAFDIDSDMPIVMGPAPAPGTAAAVASGAGGGVGGGPALLPPGAAEAIVLLDQVRGEAVPDGPRAPAALTVQTPRLVVEGASAAGANGTYFQWGGAVPPRLRGLAAAVFGKPAGDRLWLIVAWRLAVAEALAAVADSAMRSAAEDLLRRAGHRPDAPWDEDCAPAAAAAGAEPAVEAALSQVRWYLAEVTPGGDWSAALLSVLPSEVLRAAPPGPDADDETLRVASSSAAGASGDGGGDGAGRWEGLAVGGQLHYQAGPAALPTRRALVAGSVVRTYYWHNDARSANPMLAVVRESPYGGGGSPSSSTGGLSPSAATAMAFVRVELQEGAKGGAGHRVPQEWIVEVVALPPERGWTLAPASAMAAAAAVDLCGDDGAVTIVAVGTPPSVVRCPQVWLGAVGGGGGGGGGGSAAPALEVVDLCADSPGDDAIRQLREKIVEVAGVNLTEAKARQLLEKGSWNIDNATMAYFDQMDQ